MSDLLTNEEIDTLLAMFRAEGAPPDEAAGPTVFETRQERAPALISEVDLLKPNRFAREQLRAFERIFDATAKSLAAAMSDRLRLDMLCDCVAVEQARFGPWLKLVRSPCAIYVLRMPPLEIPVLFTVTTRLLYGAVDRILGGSGRVQENRQEFTAAEYTVADAFVGPCLDRLCKELAELATFTWTIESRFCNPAMAQMLPTQDVILSVHFQVSSEHMLGDLRVALPFGALSPFLGRLELGPGSAYRIAAGSARATTSKTILEVPMNLSVVLGTTQVPLRQLLALRVGDVVPVATRVGQPLVAPVQGKPKFLGQVGTRGRHLAFQVRTVLSGA